MTRVLLHAPGPVTASAYYRALLPYRHLRQELAGRGVELHLAEGISPQERWDAVVVRREVAPDLLLHLMARRRRGCRVAWDIDDDLWSVPDWSPLKLDRDQLDLLDTAHEVADAVWAS